MPRVLIIEDDAENRRAMAQFFTREDWNVLEAKDGDVGLDLALRNQPELILCDLLMPKSNGFEVCRSIREKLQPTKIIVVSGRDYGVDRRSALEAGADEYLFKPITWELLSSTIDRLLPEIPRRPDPKSMPERDSVPARIRLWGVRGSIPVPGRGTVRYGGNTSCVEVRADGEIIILDAGSGIRLLGLALDKEFGPRSMRLTLLISHTHWDHIQGLPFFSPAYNQKNLIRVLGYEGARAGLAKILASQMETPFFPVSLRQLPSHLAIEELKEMEFQVGNVEVRSKFANHPGVCVGYRLATSSGSIAYFPDNEPYEDLKLQLASRDGISEEEARDFANAERTKLVDFLEGCDVALMDTQYTDEEYAKHIGWGHSSVDSVVSLALDANVGKLILFHHDPNHDDAMIDKIVEHARTLVAKSGKPLEIEGAQEGAEILLEQRVTVA
ncbi:MAG TPA: response regulator [Candidatus Babeliales bacterium]|jgi:phosphoribosyl 1,2-cyclic phosphodiesterase/CheY-like chemotaxis protein|nr:response regulator [Candidatus Babeliales bacterium]